VSVRNYAVVFLDELQRYPAMSGAPVLIPLRRRLDVRAFGINCWTAPVGAPVIERHSEPDGDEEVYVVVRGRVRFTVGDETFDAGPATLVHVRPDTVREATAIEPRRSWSLSVQSRTQRSSRSRARSARRGCGSSQPTVRTSPRFTRTRAGNS
jgi:quercetin dioxygenase-like cupin family protein